MVIIIFVWPDFQRQQYKGRARVLNKPHSRRRRVYYYFPDTLITFNPAAKDRYRVYDTHDRWWEKKKIIIYTSWRAINTPRLRIASSIIADRSLRRLFRIGIDTGCQPITICVRNLNIGFQRFSECLVKTRTI